MAMEGYEEIEGRLRALREQPVDPAVAARHLTAMAAVARQPVSRFTRLKVAAAFAAGLVLGGTSLASAGVMGETVQNRIADTAEKVGLDLPGGTPRYHDDGVCGTTQYKNHGQYVKHGGDPKSDCGKPLSSVDKAKTPDTEGDEPSACKPPWAGNKGWDGDKAAWRAEHPECADDESEKPETDAPEVTPTTTGKPADPGSQGQGDEHRVTPTAPTPSSTVPAAAEEKGGNGNGNGGPREQAPKPDKGKPDRTEG